MILRKTQFLKEKLQVYLVSTIEIFLLELGRTNLSPKMKDFIAYHMSGNDWKEICREYLDNESEDRIKVDNLTLYDRAYTVICSLIEKSKEIHWSHMEKVLNKINKKIVKQFTAKFKEAPVQGQ